MPRSKKSKMGKNKSKMGTAHHTLASAYYIIMIAMALFLIITLVNIKSIIDPWLAYMANSTIPVP